MHRPFVLVAALVPLFAASAPAFAGDPPYLRLARDFGTPDLASSSGPKDHSQMLLHFVRRGENAAAWTKMTTVSIARVPSKDTDAATRTIIGRFHARLVATHVAIDTFDRSPIAPVTGYFIFHGKAEKDVGIIYSPRAGYVTVAQLGARGAGSISKTDIAHLRSVIGK